MMLMNDVGSHALDMIRDAEIEWVVTEWAGVALHCTDWNKAKSMA